MISLVWSFYKNPKKFKITNYVAFLATRRTTYALWNMLDVILYVSLYTKARLVFCFISGNFQEIVLFLEVFSS